MLRACVLSYSKKWDECLPLAEFSYNNSYQESIKMAPFEALYGRRCRTPLNWSEAGERNFFGPDIVQEAEEQVQLIQKNLKSGSNPSKRVMLTKSGKLSPSKWGIRFICGYLHWRGSSGSGSKESSHLAMLGLFPFLSGVGQWHTVWNSLHDCPQCITYSMSRSSENAFVFSPRFWI